MGDSTGPVTLLSARKKATGGILISALTRWHSPVDPPVQILCTMGVTRGSFWCHEGCPNGKNGVYHKTRFHGAPGSLALDWSCTCCRPPLRANLSPPACSVRCPCACRIRAKPWTLRQSPIAGGAERQAGRHRPDWLWGGEQGGWGTDCHFHSPKLTCY